MRSRGSGGVFAAWCGRSRFRTGGGGEQGTGNGQEKPSWADGKHRTGAGGSISEMGSARVISSPDVTFICMTLDVSLNLACKTKFGHTALQGFFFLSFSTWGLIWDKFLLKGHENNNVDKS